MAKPRVQARAPAPAPMKSARAMAPPRTTRIAGPVEQDLGDRQGSALRLPPDEEEDGQAEHGREEDVADDPIGRRWSRRTGRGTAGLGRRPAIPVQPGFFGLAGELHGRDEADDGQDQPVERDDERLDHPVADVRDPAAVAAQGDGEVEGAAQDAEDPGVAGGRLPEIGGPLQALGGPGASGRVPEGRPDLAPRETHEGRGDAPEDEIEQARLVHQAREEPRDDDGDDEGRGEKPSDDGPAPGGGPGGSRSWLLSPCAFRGSRTAALDRGDPVGQRDSRIPFPGGGFPRRASGSRGRPRRFDGRAMPRPPPVLGPPRLQSSLPGNARSAPASRRRRRPGGRRRGPFSAVRPGSHAVAVSFGHDAASFPLRFEPADKVRELARQSPGQSRPAAHDVDPDGRFRAAHRPGDLLIGLFLDDVEEHRRGLPPGQTADGSRGSRPADPGPRSPSRPEVRHRRPARPASPGISWRRRRRLFRTAS